MALWTPCRAPRERDFDTQIEFPVTVHVYRLDNPSWLLTPLGLSAYHSEVDIMGTVFAFGCFGQSDQTDLIEQSGVFFMGKNNTVGPQQHQPRSTAQALRCDRNCQLECRSSWKGEIRCDGCCRVLPPGTEEFSCSSCHFRLCSACVARRSALFDALEDTSPLDDHIPSSAESRGITFVETLYMGTACMSKRQLVVVLNKYMAAFQASSYQLLRNNCNHFASQLCIALTGKELPAWVNKAANVGAGIGDGMAVSTEGSYLGSWWDVSQLRSSSEVVRAPPRRSCGEMMVPAAELIRKMSWGPIPL